MPGFGFSFASSFGLSSALAGATARRDLLVDELLGDLAIDDGGDLAFVQGAEGIAQACRQALRMQLGEWFADESVGLPWLSDGAGGPGFLDKNPNLTYVRELIREALLAVPGVLDVMSLDARLSTERAMTVSFVVSSDTGELTASALEVI